MTLIMFPYMVFKLMIPKPETIPTLFTNINIFSFLIPRHVMPVAPPPILPDAVITRVTSTDLWSGLSASKVNIDCG